MMVIDDGKYVQDGNMFNSGPRTTATHVVYDVRGSGHSLDLLID